MRELSRVALQLVNPTSGHDAVASASVDRQVAASSVVTPIESSGHPASFCRWSPGGGTCCSSACALLSCLVLLLANTPMESNGPRRVDKPIFTLPPVLVKRRLPWLLSQCPHRVIRILAWWILLGRQPTA